MSTQKHKTSDEGRAKKFQIRPRSCSNQNSIPLDSIKTEQKQIGFKNFYDSAQQNNSTYINQNEIRNENNHHMNLHQIKIPDIRQIQYKQQHKPYEIDSSRIKNLREKVNNFVSNSSNLSSSFSKQSKFQDDLSQDSIISYASNRSRKASSNSSESSRDHSSTQTNPSVFSKIRQKSQSLQRPPSKRYSILGLKLNLVESNTKVEQINSVGKKNIVSKSCQKHPQQSYYFGFANDEVIDEFQNGQSVMSSNTNKSNVNTIITTRTRANSHQQISKFQQRKSLLQNNNQILNNEFQNTNSSYEGDQNYLFNCFDEYDQKKFGRVLNEDSPLDYYFLKDFIHINEQFIEDNLQFQISSLEKMHTNNCKVTIDCLMKLKIGQKNVNNIQKYVKELENKYNQNIKKINAVERNKMININLQYGSVQLNAEDFVKSPMDLIIIVDYTNQFKQELIQSINLFISLSTHHSRICLIFPDHNTGKCVRTNLISCTSQNKQILQDVISSHLFDSHNDSRSEDDEDDSCNYKKKVGFNQCAFRNALLTLSERTYINFQSALFWFSDGEQPPLYESIQDCFLQFSLENNPDHKQIDGNLSFYVFHYGNKKQIDDTLFKISTLKSGKYFYVVNINDLCLIVNQAIGDLQGNVSFSVLASIDLVEYSQIHLKDAVKEQLPEIRSRECSIMKSIHPKMQETFNSLYSDDEPIEQNITNNNNHNHNNNQQRNTKKQKNEINLKEKIVQFQQRGQKLFNTEFLKLYGGSDIWNQENSTSCSTRFSHLRSGVEKNFVFSILLKPTALLASSEIAEFIIANGTCLLLPSPNKVIYLGNKVQPVQYLKKFATCQTEIHFHLNNCIQYDISTLNYHKTSQQISYNQINIEKNQNSGKEIIKHINIQSMIEGIEEKLKLIQNKNLSSTLEITQQFQQILHKNMLNCFDSFYYEIESFFSYIKEYGFDARANCYIKCILQNYKFQSRVLFSQHLTSPLKLSNQTQLINHPKIVQIK